MAVIFGEIEIVLDEWSTGKSVIANAITTHPGIEERQREKKKKSKQPLRSARVPRGRYAEVLLVHERGTRRKPFLSPATIITGQHHDLEPISNTEGGA
ncbi:MAG: hypothetical protein DMG49_03190 [Acidobacteria bacterium]|nr:MAG: hypothetical protein DMG49_03190 [Acidobacteriota bacterium]